MEKKSKQIFALKVIDVNEAGDEIFDLQHEITFQLSCNSPYICQYFESFMHGNQLYVVVEYVVGKSITELVFFFFFFFFFLFFNFFLKVLFFFFFFLFSFNF